MKPKSEITLSDVIEEVWKDMVKLDNAFPVRTRIYTRDAMRQACEAMAKEIVPEIKVSNYNGVYTGHEARLMDDKVYIWNECRAEILKNIERFMGEKK